jgi:hypothetical protein
MEEALPIDSSEFFAKNENQTGSLRRIVLGLYGDAVQTPRGDATIVAPSPQFLLHKQQSDSDSGQITINSTTYSNVHLKVEIDQDLNDYATSLAKQVAPQKVQAEEERQREFLTSLAIDVVLVVLPEIGVCKWAVDAANAMDALSTMFTSGVAEWVTEEAIEEVSAFGFKKLMQKASKMAIGFESKAVVNVYKAQDLFNDNSLVPAEQTLLAIHRFKCLVDPAYRTMVEKVEKLRAEWAIEQKMRQQQLDLWRH